MLVDFLYLALFCNLIITIPFSVATTVPYPSRSQTNISIPSVTDKGSNIGEFNKNNVPERSGNNGLPV